MYFKNFDKPSTVNLQFIHFLHKSNSNFCAAILKDTLFKGHNFCINSKMKNLDKLFE